MHFEVAVGEYLPYLKLTPLFGHVHMSGPLAEAFHFLSVNLNFTYTLHRVKGNSWGMNGPDGWTGMLGMVDRKEVDMAVGPFTLTYDRWSSFKLSVPVYVDNVEILVPASEWKMSLFSVITVFSSSVWIYTFIALIAMSFATTVIDKYRHADIAFHFRLFKNFEMLLGTLLLKGRKEKPDFYLQYFLTILWLLSAFVLSSTFGGALLTRLFVRKVQKIDSIEDLIAARKVQPILENHSSVYSMFKNSQAEVYRIVYERALEKPDRSIMSYTNMSTTGMDYVMSGSAAMITDGMGLRGFMAARQKEGLPCRFWLAKETLMPMWKVIAFSETFPDDWVAKINNHLRYTLDSGWLQTRMQRVLGQFEECLVPPANNLNPLGLEHTRGVFLIWSMGVVTAIIIFVVELLVVKSSRNVHAREPISETHRNIAVSKTREMIVKIGVVSEKSDLKGRTWR